MIVTPKELNNWSLNGKDFVVLDIRPKNQISKFPLLDLDHIKGDLSSIKNIEKRIILVCQFGIITEGAIIEQNLKNTYSLLGGVQAWNEFQENNIDLSRWSRQTVLEEIGISGQQKILDVYELQKAAGAGHIQQTRGQKSITNRKFRAASSQNRTNSAP